MINLVNTHLRVIVTSADISHTWAEVELCFETCIAFRTCASFVMQNNSCVEPFMAQPASVAQGHAAQPAAPVPVTEAFGWLAAL